MTYYFVDYENITDTGLDGIDSLKKKDRVIVFYSRQVKHISFEKHVEIAESRCSIEYILIEKTAKNYLDFQLSTYLGYLISKKEPDRIVIITRDTGYNSVVDFWKEREINISIQDAISEKAGRKVKAEEPRPKLSGDAAGKRKRKKKLTAGQTKTIAYETAADQGQSSEALKADAVLTVSEPVRNARSEKQEMRKTQSTEGEKQRDSVRRVQINKAPKLRAKEEKIKKESKMEQAVDSQDVSTNNEISVGTPAANAAKADEPAPRKAELPVGTSAANAAKADEPAPSKTEPPVTTPVANTAKADEPATSKAEVPVGTSAANAVKADEPAPSKAEVPVGTPPKKSVKTEEKAPAKKVAKKKTAAPKDLPEAWRKRVRAAVKADRLPSASYPEIYRAIAQSRNAMELNNRLAQLFKNEMSRTVYWHVKDIFGQYKKALRNGGSAA